MATPEEQAVAVDETGNVNGRSASMRMRPQPSKSGSVFGLGPRLSSVRIDKSPTNVDKLYSQVFNSENPPMDWADIGLLIPHEAICHEMTMMVQSANALPDSPSDNEYWKAILFSKWYIDYLFVMIDEHHYNEEKIYFPWIKSKTEYPEKKFSKDHETLVAEMHVMKVACETICKKGGKGCEKEIALLKTRIPTFEKDMREHLKEEESTVPKLLRDNFTQEEEEATVEKILQAGGLVMAKKFLPSVLTAMQKWAKDEFYEDFCGAMPPPIKHLTFKYYLPDYENVVVQMRDAPTLEKKPKLKKVGCCGIPFCFPCVL
mmetsp:Transcript_1047/g.1822  ORF Transcript_1047/g.1822 Transcript_1047/m.1822 type:complete len:317 (-) Transcript_1047:150-1100(-)|eukprot:CAMPEP_0183729860 /NCGR_PEP_ID=MMETSP0737-20130205/31394_1 /TAXON_ID=385413 /ORGANISM="Thalassiosira miniscula, Strain CCMP1093" /LENGTH=316 /DNA_ID=CAMNT_0025962171 /DNA_START=188 /DNA_END=1138 /DNA_ORIENTATION=-